MTEKLTLSMGVNKLKIENSQNPHGYEYSGEFLLEDSKYLSGNWKSTRPGASASGGFLLTLASQGTGMYGYWVGPDQFGARRYGRWVLAKSEENIPDMKALLDEMRKPY